MVTDFRAWEKSNLHNSGLFWSNDDRDGGEFSISGNGLRPTLNSYLCAYASTIAKTAELAGRHDIRTEYESKSEKLKSLINNRLWDAKSCFFKAFPLESKDTQVDNWSFDSISPGHNVKELLGYIPWYFNIAYDGLDIAWEQIKDAKGFYAPFGFTTAEQRHERFMFPVNHECLWNGPSWPFATSMTLTAMLNLIRNYDQKTIHKKDFLFSLKTYSNCHKRKKANGDTVRWLDENIDPFTGEWISRNILKSLGWKPENGGYERGKDYNHSTYCDLIITGLAGLIPSTDNTLIIDPIIPDEWKYFYLGNILYHNKSVTILYDRDGTRYHQGSGFQILIDGEIVKTSDCIERVEIILTD